MEGSGGVVPVWAVIGIVVGVLLTAAALAAAGFFGWHAYRRRLLLRLVVKAEAVDALVAALVDTITRLSEASDEDLERFASDTESGERRALHEIAFRGGLLAEELDRIPLPPSLVPPATALADTAYLVGSEASKVTDEQIGSDALEGLAAVDLAAIQAYQRKGRAVLGTTCDVCGLDDTAVYGGGLYL